VARGSQLASVGRRLRRMKDGKPENGRSRMQLLMMNEKQKVMKKQRKGWPFLLG